MESISLLSGKGSLSDEPNIYVVFLQPLYLGNFWDHESHDRTLAGVLVTKVF